MQKRLIQALIFIAVAIGLAVGVAGAAGAIGPAGHAVTDGMTWGWGGAAPAAATAELASA